MAGHGVRAALLNTEAAYPRPGTAPQTLKCRSGCCPGAVEQAQLAGTGHGFGAPLDLQLAKDLPLGACDRMQGEGEPLADLVIRESSSDERQHLQLAPAQRLDQGLGRRRRGPVFAPPPLDL